MSEISIRQGREKIRDAEEAIKEIVLNLERDLDMQIAELGAVTIESGGGFGHDMRVDFRIKIVFKL